MFLVFLFVYFCHLFMFFCYYRGREYLASATTRGHTSPSSSSSFNEGTQHAARERAAVAAAAAATALLTGLDASDTSTQRSLSLLFSFFFLFFFPLLASSAHDSISSGCVRFAVPRKRGKTRLVSITVRETKNSIDHEDR